MGRHEKVPEYELLDYLEEKDGPVPNSKISEDLEIAVVTVRRTVKKARKNGHPIFPTQGGQWLIKRITSPEQLIAVLDTIGWTSDVKREMSRIVDIGKRIEMTATKRIEKEAQAIEATG